jgi:hypothetical protein
MFGPVAKALLRCGALAGPLFVSTFTIAGGRREGYDPRRHPVSALALGPGCAVQRANFIGAGAGLIGAALFATDPVSGYPVGTPAQPDPPTRTGAVQNLCAIPVFAGISAAALLSARTAARAHEQGWAIYSAASGALMMAASIGAGAGFGQQPAFVGSAGLLQRVSILAGFGWITTLCLTV